MPSSFKGGMRYRDIKQVMVTGFCSSELGIRRVYALQLWLISLLPDQAESADAIPERQVVPSKVKIMR